MLNKLSRQSNLAWTATAQAVRLSPIPHVFRTSAQRILFRSISNIGPISPPARHNILQRKVYAWLVASFRHLHVVLTKAEQYG